MKQNISKSGILLLVLSFLFAFQSCNQNQQDHKPTLGLALPLTGQLAWLGSNIQDGLNFY